VKTEKVKLSQRRRSGALYMEVIQRRSAPHRLVDACSILKQRVRKLPRRSWEIRRITSNRNSMSSAARQFACCKLAVSVYSERSNGAVTASWHRLQYDAAQQINAPDRANRRGFCVVLVSVACWHFERSRREPARQVIGTVGPLRKNKDAMQPGDE